jgi:hypothetical protein
MTQVAALFVDLSGPYPALVSKENCWDIARDARLYSGPHPVIAHPPCQLWVNLAAVNWKRYGRQKPAWYPGGTDEDCFASALANVRKYGGVLEHPAFTHAWAKYKISVPKENCWTECDSSIVGTSTIRLDGDKETLVDIDDCPVLIANTWQSFTDKSGNTYAVRRIGTGSESRQFRMHLQLLGEQENKVIDHINGNGLDNRRFNLRHVTVSQNGANRKKQRYDSLSRFKGVTRNQKRCQWQASIRINGKLKWLGYHDTEELAALAYDRAALEIFGQYARPNITKEKKIYCAEVWQSAYGHKARKRTWLLYCGSRPPFELNWAREPGECQIGWFDRNKKTLSKRESSLSPLPFAQELVRLAQWSRS